MVILYRHCGASIEPSRCQKRGGEQNPTKGLAVEVHIRSMLMLSTPIGFLAPKTPLLANTVSGASFHLARRGRCDVSISQNGGTRICNAHGRH